MVTLNTLTNVLKNLFYIVEACELNVGQGGSILYCGGSFLYGGGSWGPGIPALVKLIDSSLKKCVEQQVLRFLGDYSEPK